MRISCDDCVMQGTDQCGDCVVSFILAAEDEQEVVVDADAARALRALGEAGLVPRLGFIPRDREAG